MGLIITIPEPPVPPDAEFEEEMTLQPHHFQCWHLHWTVVGTSLAYPPLPPAPMGHCASR